LSDAPSIPAVRFRGLARWERRGLVALAVLVILFGLVVEKRSAFMQRRMTDLGVYLRVAWAVRAGEDIYDTIDNNGWHYQYPPLFAILMVPLADPPAGVRAEGVVPYPVAVALWYGFSVLCLAAGVHTLARALEEQAAPALGGIPPTGCRRWWMLRVVPVLACITPIGHTLMRGQVNLLLLTLLCATAAALVRGRSRRAGLWLSGAICLKVIPAFLLLVPLWRRDFRCLAACALGLVIGLLVIPAAVFGLPRTLEYYREYDEKLLRPAQGRGTDQSRAEELIMMTRNDSQSVLAAIHNSLHPDRLHRPDHPTVAVRWTARIVVSFLTVCTLLAAGWRRTAGGAAVVLFLGALVLDMLLYSPVCHLHYFSLLVPLVMGLLDCRWKGQANPRLGKGLLLLFAANVVGNMLPNLPGMELVRDLGLAMYASLALWLLGCIWLWKERRAPASQPQTLPRVSGAAA
jgi:hypothetical protein